MNRLRVTPSVIPNLFTAMNMFCGFLSIINTGKGNYDYAAWLIIIGAIFDALDGLMARLTMSSSELGVELDSLSDVVCFGAAPAYLIYTIHLYQYSAWGIIISSLLLIAGGFRLARFNVQLVGFDKSFFKGLPIPGSGITIASFILAFYDNETGFPESLNSFIIPLVLILSYLMISKIKYDTFPKFSLNEIKKKPVIIIVPVLAISLLIFFTIGRAIFYVFVFIIVFGIFRHIFNYFKKFGAKSHWPIAKIFNKFSNYSLITFPGVELYKATVIIKRRPSILDPQGKAVEKGAFHLGLNNVKNTRIGKYIEFDVDINDKSAVKLQWKT